MMFIVICLFLLFSLYFVFEIFHVLYLWAKNIVVKILKKRVENIERKYPRAYKQFTNNINKYTPEFYSLRKVTSRPETIWKQEEKVLEEQENQQKKLNQKCKELASVYPNGFRHWKLLNPCKTLDEIIASESEIHQFEKFYQENQSFNSWEKEQKVFAERSDDIAEEYLTKFGGRTYNIPFEKTDIDGKKATGTYKIWQYFLRELCLDEDLDYTLFPDENECFAKLPKFKAKTRYFKEEVYKQIIDFINELQREERVLVYINGDVPGWSVDSLYYHYQNIFSAFDEKNMYAPVLYETLGSPHIDWKSNLKRRIVIIDMMTENSHLKEICGSIIKEAKEKQPLITYISLLKCYSREEAQKLIDDKRKKYKEGDRKCKEEEEADRKAVATLRQKRMILGAAESKGWPTVKDVHHYFFYYYYPTQFDDITEFDWDVRNLIWNFKNGTNHDRVCQILTTKLRNVYGEALDLLTFVCIPASTREVNHKRYHSFMIDVCNATGMANGYDHITIVREKVPSRLGGNSSAEYDYDKDFFNGRQIILFDDVVTRGRSLAKMKIELESIGAHIVAALSIGRTYSDYHGASRQPHPWVTETE